MNKDRKAASEENRFNSPEFLEEARRELLTYLNEGGYNLFETDDYRGVPTISEKKSL